MTALDDVLTARVHLHQSTYWPAAQRAKGTNKLWLTDVDLASAIQKLTPPPAPPVAFTKTLAAGGSLDHFLDSLVPGDVAGIAPGTYPLSSYSRQTTATAQKPILVTSTDPLRPAIVGDGGTGRLSVFGQAAYWTFRLLGFDGITPDGSSWTLGGNNVRFEMCDMSNFNTNIGVMNITGTGVTLDRCRIHDCGIPGDNTEHGVYDEGDGMHLVDCLIYRCAARGIQCRGGHNALYEYCTISECGEGIIFGDDRGAVNSKLTKSILMNHTEPLRYLVEALGSANSGNLVDDCVAFSKDGYSLVQPGIGSSVTVTNLHTSDPKLNSDLISTAYPGYGCRTLPPKILPNA